MSVGEKAIQHFYMNFHIFDKLRVSRQHSKKVWIRNFTTVQSYFKYVKKKRVKAVILQSDERLRVLVAIKLDKFFVTES